MCTTAKVTARSLCTECGRRLVSRLNDDIKKVNIKWAYCVTLIRKVLDSSAPLFSAETHHCCYCSNICCTLFVNDSILCGSDWNSNTNTEGKPHKNDTIETWFRQQNEPCDGHNSNWAFEVTSKENDENAFNELNRKPKFGLNKKDRKHFAIFNTIIHSFWFESQPQMFVSSFTRLSI